MTVTLGIDVGTSGCKALLVTADGTVVAEHTTDYPLHTSKPLWSEQDPDDWWRGAAGSIRGVLDESGIDSGAISAVGLTGQMHGLVCLDAAGKPCRRAILWNDQRTYRECRAIEERVGLDTLIRITGKPALTGFTAPKILWLRAHEPVVLEATESICLPKDYVRFKLTGGLAMDLADASGTLLLDVSRRRWSQELIDALEVPVSWLPPLHESPDVVGAVDDAGAAETGLRSGTPVVAGAGDQAAEAVGCGIVEDRQVSVAIGTSGVVFISTDTCQPDPEGRLHAYCHAVPGRWHLMGVILSAGGSLRWFRDTFAPETSYDDLTAEAVGVEAARDGLFFVPYLTGERTPHADPDARACFIGATIRHRRAHFVRAVLEGVAFALRDALELYRADGSQVTRVRVSGGGSRSDLWRRIMADVFDTEVATVNSTHGAAFGAALLGAVGAGIHDTVTGASSVVSETGVTTPGTDRACYDDSYQTYRSLYPSLATTFRKVSRAGGVL